MLRDARGIAGLRPDIGRIELGAQAYATSARLNGKPSTGIGVQLSPNGNALATAEAVRTKMAELERFFPEGVNWSIPYDSSRFVKISIQQVAITLAEAIDPEPRRHLRGVWNLLYTGPGDCDALCKERLVDLRQMRLTFGKDAPRLQLVYLADSGDVDNAYMATEHPVMFVVPATQSVEQLSALKDYAAGDVYLVDPQGNVILRYPRNMTVAEIRDDIKKLLKLSQIG